MSLRAEVLEGDCRVILAELPAGSVQCVVTSPPYWGLRDYGYVGQLGLEPTPELYVAHLVEIFRGVRRVLREDGVVWVNLGDSYANAGSGSVGSSAKSTLTTASRNGAWAPGHVVQTVTRDRGWPDGLKPKDLVGIPWRVAFALQADGWYLRADVIWAKPNPMPESVTDRPTKAHEYVFLLSKRERYFYDAEAVREAATYEGDMRHLRSDTSKLAGGPREDNGSRERTGNPVNGRNLRSVWNIATQPYPDAHFATFPEALVVPCIKAGTSEYGACAQCGAPWARVVERTVPIDPGRGESKLRDADGLSARAQSSAQRQLGQAYQDQLNAHPPITTGWRPTCACEAAVVPCTVLDPFAGSGTVLLVANALGRHAIGIEANAAYVHLARQRLVQGVLL